MPVRKSLILLAVLGSAVIGVILISAGGFFMGVKKELDHWKLGRCMVLNRTCDEESKYSNQPNAIWDVIWLPTMENGTVTTYREECKEIGHPIGGNYTCYRSGTDFDWDHRQPVGYEFTIPMVTIGAILVIGTMVYTCRPRNPSYTFKAEDEKLLPDMTV